MSSPLTQTDISYKVKKLSGWNYENNKLSKSYKFNNFKESLAFIVRIGLEAEIMQHHPEIYNVYNRVKIDLQTHDAGAKVTQKDIDLASAIDKIV
ncbi:MAG: 4a-hydroxytetrahydrobiopterin dehydratase [Balneolaceae bacterium]